MEPEELRDRIPKLERIKEDFCDLAGFPPFDPDAPLVTAPKEYVEGLRERGSPVVEEIHGQLTALENALYRLKVQYAMCHAYNLASEMTAEHGLITTMDHRWAEHYGFAVFTLYAAWNQVAALLNAVLAWGVNERDVLPGTAKDKLAETDLRSDPLLADLLALHEGLGAHRLDRNFEAHRQGQAHLIFTKTIAHLNSLIGTDVGTQGESARRKVLDDEVEKHASVREQLEGLQRFLRGFEDFIRRNLAHLLELADSS